VGKVTAAWLAAIVFFGLGLEHCVINMFLIPAGMLLGAPISVGEFVVWNLVPVSLGNTVGGLVVVIGFCWVNGAMRGRAAGHG
jgi:formate/nitrite transporter FocA (FNT family)